MPFNTSRSKVHALKFDRINRTLNAMNYTEFIVSSIPLFLALLAMVYVVKKTGAFKQQEHRKRVEELLERIARAVEK
jgi:hypothetical protein